MPSLVAEAFQAKANGAKPLSLKSIFSASGIKGKRLYALSAEENGLTDFIQTIIAEKPEMDLPFSVLDLGVVMGLMDKWASKLPTVQPFYAVKCTRCTGLQLRLRQQSRDRIRSVPRSLTRPNHLRQPMQIQVPHQILRQRWRQLHNLRFQRRGTKNP